MVTRPDPYVRKDPNNIIRSGDWNELQVLAREEIRSHTHAGEEDGKKIGMESIFGPLKIPEDLIVDGNVGIGTASPQARLHIEGGDVAIQNQRRLVLNQGAGGNNFLQSPEADQSRLGIFTASVERLSVDYSTGNVGIGSTEPGNSRLKLQGSNAYYSLYVVNELDVPDDVTNLARFQTSDATNRGLWIDVYNAGRAGEYVRLGSLGNIPLSILPSGGNVGIGTTNPGAKLHVNDGAVHIANAGGYLMLGTEVGGAYIREIEEDVPIQFGTNDAGAHGFKMILKANGNVGIGTTDPAYKLHVSAEHTTSLLRLERTGSAEGYVDFDIADEYLQISTKNHKAVLNVNAGNVGIGTTEPDRELSVNGILKISRPGDEDSWTTGNWSKGIELENGNSIQFLKGGIGDSRGIGGNLGSLYFLRSSADDSSAAATIDMIIDPDGNVGIGTAQPATQFHLASDSDHAFLMTRGNGRYGMRILRDASGGVLHVQNTDTYGNFGTRIRIDEGGSYWENLIINPDGGNVGIGTTTPGAKLDVNGAASVDRLNVLGDGYGKVNVNVNDNEAAFSLHYPGAVAWQLGRRGSSLTISQTGGPGSDSMGTDRVTITNSGNVGIGTTTPHRKLHIGEGGQVSLLQSSSVATDSQAGIYWDMADNYGIYRTPGPWTHVSYQQLKLHWPTGIILEPGTGDDQGYDKSYVEITGGKGLRVTQGNVGIGTTTPSFKLDVRGSGAWIGSGDSSQTLGGWRLGRWPAYNYANNWVYLSRADGTAYQDLAVGALHAGGNLRFGSASDLAEMTPVKTEDALEAGDVVVIDTPLDDRVLLAKSQKPYDSKLAGVVSDPSTAGVIIGGSHPTYVDRDDLKPIALAGRVLTKVCAENGSIDAGDSLTVSSKPGHAMKATKSGHTLGKALQPFNGGQDGAATGRIWVLVNLAWSDGVNPT